MSTYLVRLGLFPLLVVGTDLGVLTEGGREREEEGGGGGAVSEIRTNTR